MSERGESPWGPTKKVATGMPSGDGCLRRPRAQRRHMARTTAKGHRTQEETEIWAGEIGRGRRQDLGTNLTEGCTSREGIRSS